MSEDSILRKKGKKISAIRHTLLNLGVHNDLPVYESKLVRFTNFLEMFSLFFYSFYLSISFIIHAPFATIACAVLIISGCTGLWFNHRRKYQIARAIFSSSFSIVIFFVINTLNIGPSFFTFFFPTFVSFALYYELDAGLRTGLISLAITVASAVCSYALPHQLFYAENLEEKWQPFVEKLNYSLAIAITLNFIFFIVNHIHESGKKLVQDWKEEERQKLIMTEEKSRAEAAALAKSQFLSHMSHEMRTPLNGIVGTVQLMLQETFLPQQQQNLEVLKYSSEHMLSVVNDILDFSKIDAGKMELAEESFNVKETLNKVFTIFRHQFRNKGLALVFRAGKSVDRDFKGDETRLKQVLTNLLGNALKFTDRGKVVIEASLLNENAFGAEIEFSVTDTGIGMRPDQQQIVFDAFSQAETSTTRKFGGTGLGLTISKRIVDLMGGALHVDSTPGKGSRFYFSVWLPYALEPAQKSRTAMENDLAYVEGMKILVAEDSHVNMIITRKFLQRWGAHVDEAFNGREAIDLFRTGVYDLLLIDLDMPVMDGYETLRQIRTINRSIPAIAFTAAVMPDMKARLAELGFNGFLQKPFRPEDLRHIISLHKTSVV